MIRIIIFTSFFICCNVHAVNAQEFKSITMSKQTLINAGEINIYFSNFDFDTEIEVMSYMASAYIRAGDISIKVNGTNKFTKEVIDLIKKVRRNERIYFENIKVKLADGTIRNLQPIVVRVR